MPIRLISKDGNLASIASTLEVYAPAITGTHAIPLGYTGTLEDNLENYVPAFAGVFTATPSRTGSVAAAVADLIGFLLSPGNVAVGTLVQDAVTVEQIALYLPVTGSVAQSATAAVEYKKTSSGTWLNAQPMWRIQPQYTSENPADAFAGTIFGLDPGTPYDIRVTVIDTSGSEVITDTFSTRALPATAGGATSSVTSQASLVSAISSASPGDVIEITSSLTLSSQVTITGKNGTSNNPIYIRGTDRDSIVVNRNNGRCFLVNNSSHIVFENFTFTGSGVDAGQSPDSMFMGITDTSGVPDSITIRNMRIQDVDHAVDGVEFTDARNVLIYDNIIDGNNKYIAGWGEATTSNDTWNDEGIKLAGRGHCWFNNTISWFGDTFAVQHSPNVGLGSESRGIFIYRNDIWYSGDDAVEFDYTDRNNAFYDNRITNAATGISIDGIYGGPIYVFRNRIINTRRFLVKNGDQATGCLFYNNTMVVTEGMQRVPGEAGQEFGWYWPSAAVVRDWEFINNIVIFEGTSHVFWAEATHQDPVLLNHNAWGRNGTTIIWDGVGSGSGTVAQVNASLSPIFDNDIETDQAGMFVTPVAFGSDWSTPITTDYTLELKSGSEAIGTGVLLANINDST